jgi:3-oxoacyl-[acyl-carrier protein] reductase
MRLEGKGALVTGAAGGIGGAVARRFAEEGAAVALGDISGADAEALAGEITSAGGRAIGLTLDVTDAASVRRAVARAKEELGGLHILINNAGILRDAMAGKMTDEEWSQVLRVHLDGTFLCSREVIEGFRDQGYGRIVNTSSTSSLGNIGQANYAAAKAGIIGLTRTLALELARHSITVNAVAPGPTQTPMLDSVPEKPRQWLLSRVPLGRFGTPEEIAALHLFLASEEAGFITGQVIFCDGGASVGT